MEIFSGILIIVISTSAIAGYVISLVAKRLADKNEQQINRLLELIQLTNTVRRLNEEVARDKISLLYSYLGVKKVVIESQPETIKLVKIKKGDKK
jgi:hypothetical protein